MSPTAAANWTQGQLDNLVPASWTVTDGNKDITGIRCDFTKGAIASYYECAQRLGHNRARCYGDMKINGTTVCTCTSYSGWTTSCDEARCTYGTISGCATRDPTVYYLNAVLCSINLIIVTFTLMYALSTVWKGRAMCSRNVTNTTLAWLSLAALSLWLYFGSIFLANIVLSSDELMVCNYHGNYERMILRCTSTLPGTPPRIYRQHTNRLISWRWVEQTHRKLMFTRHVIATRLSLIKLALLSRP